MFFVFGPLGRVVRSGQEALRRVAPVRPGTSRAQRLDTRSPDTHTPPEPMPSMVLRRQHPQPDAVFPSDGSEDGQELEGAPSRLQQQVVSAYGQGSASGLGQVSQRQPLSRVEEVMSHNPTSVPPHMRLHHAWMLLADLGYGQAPVVNDAGQVVGLLLRTDMSLPFLLPEASTMQQAVAQANREVAQVMVTPVPTVSPQAPLRYAAGVLIQNDLPGLPVTDEDGKLVGFVSRTDLLRAMAADPPIDLWG